MHATSFVYNQCQREVTTKMGTILKDISSITRAELLRGLEQYPDGLVILGSLDSFNRRKEALGLVNGKELLINMDNTFVGYSMDGHQGAVLVNAPEKNESRVFILLISVQRGQNHMDKLLSVGFNAIQYAKDRTSHILSHSEMMRTAFQFMMSSVNSLS